MTKTLRTLAVALVLALAVSGCSKKGPQKPKGIGKPLAMTPARELVVTPDGKTAVFLGEINPPPEKDVPEGIFQGILTTVPVAGGTQRQLGGGVPTVEGAFRVSADGRYVAYLQGFHFRDQTGTLFIAKTDAGDPKQIAVNATFLRFSPDGKLLGYVADGDMHLLDVDSGDNREVVKQAATFEFSSDGKQVLIRKPLSAGGELLLGDVASKAAPKKLGTNIGEYEFSPDGKIVAYTARVGGPAEPYTLFIGPVTGEARKVAEGVSSFLFSPDSKWLAFIGGISLNKTLGDLEVVGTDGGPSRKLGDDVVEQRWSPSSSGIAFRESHEDKRGRKWVNFRVATMPEGKVKDVSDNVPNFAWSFDGTEVAFLKKVSKPDFSVNLMLYKLGEEQPKMVDKGVFGYQFAPGDRALWYRTNCIRNARECDLMSVAASGEGYPVKVVQGIWNFRPNAAGDRLLLMYPRVDTEAAADLGVLYVGAKQPSKGIDQYTLPGAQFLDKEGTRVGYIVTERKREGVYIADVP